MGLEFRKYSAEDRADCIDVFRSNIPKYFRDFEQPEFEGFLDAGQHPYFVATLSSARIIGCGGFGVTAGATTADLCWGMVASDFHGRHIGEFLLAGRLRAILGKRDDIDSVRLSTSQLTDGFYQKYGFAVVERQVDGIAEGLDTVQMRLSLTGEIRCRMDELWSAKFLQH